MTQPPPIPEEPKFTPQQMAGLHTLFHRVVNIAAVNAGWNRTCISCCHFNEAAEQCTFYSPAMRPPARVIVTGCDAHAANPF